MKDQQIIKKVLSIALSAMVGVSATLLLSAHAGGGNEDKKEKSKITTQSSNSSSSSSSSTIEDLLNELPESWKLGDKGYEKEEADLLDLICQKWSDFWNAYYGARYAASHASKDAIWKAAPQALGYDVWKKNSESSLCAVHKVNTLASGDAAWKAAQNATGCNAIYAALSIAEEANWEQWKQKQWKQKGTANDAIINVNLNWKQKGATYNAIINAAKNNELVIPSSRNGHLRAGNLVGSKRYFINLVNTLDKHKNRLNNFAKNLKK